MISAIACLDYDNGIGRNGSIPWTLKPDMKFFRKMTLNSTVIMGRLTWESINSKPLPKRINIVITSKPNTIQDAIACPSIKDAINIAQTYANPIFFIGGSNIYRECIPFVSKIYLTRIDKSYDCDVKFPIDEMEDFQCDYGDWNDHEEIKYRFESYTKKI